MMKKMLTAALALGVSAMAAHAADKIKVGVITTMTTPAAVLGKEQMSGFDMALKHLNKKIGGLPVELFVEDDGFKPDIGKQKADKLVKQDDVDVVTGIIWSHVLLAAQKPVLDAGKILISANAGHSRMAGKGCHKNFFNASWQNDMIPRAMGEVLNQRGVKSLYVMAPNYAAGKDMVNGLESMFKGEIKGKDFTKWGKDAQLDFQAELSKAKASGAEAIFVFYPGKAGGAFMKQFAQTGAGKTMQLYTIFTVDGVSLPKFQAADMKGVLGSLDTMHWNVDFDNEQNKRFVEDYRKEYGKYPSFYAAQAYDVMFMLDAAVKKIDGKVEDKDALAKALASTSYPSVRGEYTTGKNHFPVQNYYLREVVVGDDGKWTHKTIKTVLENAVDPHAANCSM